MMDDEDHTVALALRGKTILRIDSGLDPYDGRETKARMTAVFTDHSMVEFIGGGDDCDEWLSVEELTLDELNRRLAMRIERQDEQTARKQKHEEWLALTCQQREAEINARPAEESIVNAIYRSMLRKHLEVQSRMFSTPKRTVKDPCPKCRESECPNAPEREIPAHAGISDRPAVSSPPERPHNPT